MSAAVEQSRRKANMVAQGGGKCGFEADPKIPPNQKKGLQGQIFIKRFLTRGPLDISSNFQLL